MTVSDPIAYFNKFLNDNPYGVFGSSNPSLDENGVELDRLLRERLEKEQTPPPQGPPQLNR